MKRYYMFFIWSLFSACFISCKQDSLLLYEDIARIQFGPRQAVYYNSSSKLADTLKNYSFAYSGVEKVVDTVYFDIYTMGLPQDKDRSFLLEQIKVENVKNAVPGVHYKAFDHSDNKSLLRVKAGQSHAQVPIVLYRDASLATEEVLLKFQVVQNDYFQPGQQELLWRKLVFTDKLIKPSSWTGTLESNYYGAYSEAKHRFMITVTGQKWDEEFMSEIRVYTEIMQYWVGQVKSALAAHTASNPNSPIIDENTKQPIVFP